MSRIRDGRQAVKGMTLPKLMARLFGQQNTLTVSRELILALEHDLAAALLCSQLIYWRDRADDPDGWVHKTYGQWKEELALSEYQVRRATKKLEGLGFLATKLRKVNGAPTLHYLFDTSRFSEWILENLQIRDLTNSRIDPEVSQGSLLTETTAETTQRKRDPELDRFWVMTLEGVSLPDKLAHDVARLTPRSWTDGVLTLHAPADVALRLRRRTGELLERLQPVAPVALVEVRIVNGG